MWSGYGTMPHDTIRPCFPARRRAGRPEPTVTEQLPGTVATAQVTPVERLPAVPDGAAETMKSCSDRRTGTGYMLDDDIKSEPEFFNQLERLETVMSVRHPYNLMAKFCHLIAARDEAPLT